MALSLQFEGVLIEVRYRIDMRIHPLVVVENKTVEQILPIPINPKKKLNLREVNSCAIINGNVILLRDGIQRVVRNHPEKLTSGHE